MAPDQRRHPRDAALTRAPRVAAGSAAVAGVPHAAAPSPPAVAPDDDLARRLAAAPDAPALAALLGSLEPPHVDDATLVDLVAAAVRVQAWAYATAARLAAELSHRPSMTPTWSQVAGGAPTEGGVAGDELAMRLSWSRRRATRLVRHGRAFAAELAATGDALDAGQIDTVSAQIIADRLADVPCPLALDVQDRVLPDAGRRTPTQLRRDLERALILADPSDAARRHARARTGRRVDRPRLLPDGMAGLWSVLPATDAARVDATLDAAARTARGAGDPRTLDQLRADGLVDLLLRTGCSGAPGDTGGAPEPAAAAGGSAAGAAAPAGAAAAGASDPAPGPGHRCRTAPRAQVHVTVPLSTLLGVDDRPAELTGYGPIDATAARALAEGGVWQRLVTDPLSDTVLDVGRTRYRPPPGMVEHVQARDRTCARPGCSADAASCDLDHTREFHPRPGPPGSGAGATSAPGTTAAHNLGPLCRRDHRLKTDGGYTLSQPTPGVYEWRTPTGHRYRVVPGAHGRHQHLGATPGDAGPRGAGDRRGGPAHGSPGHGTSPHGGPRSVRGPRDGPATTGAGDPTSDAAPPF